MTKITEEKYTYLGVILDKSGSMHGLEEDIKGGITAEFQAIRDNASKGGTCFVSYMEFESVVFPKFWNRRPEVLRPLTEYTPGGGTALYDALGSMLTYMQTVPHSELETTAFRIKVFTDGAENSSTVWKGPRLAKLIRKLQKTNRWTIDFVGANLDLKKLSAEISIPVANTLTWIPTRGGTQVMSGQSVGSTQSYFNSRSVGETASVNLYSETVQVTTDNTETENA